MFAVNLERMAQLQLLSPQALYAPDEHFDWTDQEKVTTSLLPLCSVCHCLPGPLTEEDMKLPLLPLSSVCLSASSLFSVSPPLSLTHSLSPVLVVVMGSMELKTSRSLMLIL